MYFLSKLAVFSLNLGRIFFKKLLIFFFGKDIVSFVVFFMVNPPNSAVFSLKLGGFFLLRKSFVFWSQIAILGSVFISFFFIMQAPLITIGLEIHLKLATKTKIFCRCANEQNFDTNLPNTNICPICTGQPGALPQLSQEVVEKALLLGKALNCRFNQRSTFDRKSYFYPDLPMGYQITQLYRPINVDGKVAFFLENYEQEKEV